MGSREITVWIDERLECFLVCRGEQLLDSGREKRLTSNHSITIRGNTWYDHATRQGGKAISFLQYHYRMNFPEAVQTLLDRAGNGGASGILSTAAQ